MTVLVLVITLLTKTGTMPQSNGEHQFERLRWICFLALTVQVLKFDVKNNAMQAPKTLEAYNYGICHRWLEQYYTTEFYIPQPWRVGTVWKQTPTWADLLQQLFDWDDQQRYKIPFSGDSWDQIQFRSITRHAYGRIKEHLGIKAALEWKKSLRLYATRFIWMISKCTSTRFKITAKNWCNWRSQQTQPCYVVVFGCILWPFRLLWRWGDSWAVGLA